MKRVCQIKMIFRSKWIKSLTLVKKRVSPMHDHPCEMTNGPLIITSDRQQLGQSEHDMTRTNESKCKQVNALLTSESIKPKTFDDSYLHRQFSC